MSKMDKNICFCGSFGVGRPTELKATDNPVECPLCLRPSSATALALAGPLQQFRNHDGKLVIGRTRTKRGPRPLVEKFVYDESVDAQGQLQPIAARVLMKVLYAARVCRFDLLRAVGSLATKVTKWDSD